MHFVPFEPAVTVPCIGLFPRFFLAARMESTGAANRIQMSSDTAKLLQAAGKKWAKKREDAVEAKVCSLNDR